MSKPGRPAHAPTDEQRAAVAALCSFGVTHKEIAKYIGIDDKTLQKHYRPELDTAHLARNKKVGEFLYRAASGEALEDGAKFSDCVRAAMFWGKTRMGLRETNNLDITSGDKPVKNFADMYATQSRHDDEGDEDDG